MTMALPQLPSAVEHGIEWLNRPGTVGRTWNPLAGCTKVAPGCKNCYAMTMARRLAAMGDKSAAGRHPDARASPKLEAYRKVVKRDEAGLPLPQWNNRIELIPEALTEPLRWKKPATVFMSMTDLFHEQVPFEYIDRVLAVMALTPRHTYLILTKRPERAAEYLASRDRETGDQCEKVWNAKVRIVGKPVIPMFWPLPNLWLGCSVSDQKTADEAIPHLLRCPAEVRFVSYEPALGPVDFTKIVLKKGDGSKPDISIDALKGWCGGANQMGRTPIDWLIVGGESGPGARPTDIAWHSSARDQCRAAGVPFFEKQLGKRPVQDSGDSFGTYMRWEDKWATHIYRDKVCFDARGRVCDIGEHFMRARDEQTFPVRICRPLLLRDPKGGDWNEWPEDMRVRQWPEVRG